MKIDAVASKLANMTQQLEEKNQMVDFSEMMKGYLDDVNDMQVKADNSTNDLIIGKTDNVHEVMIAAEEARLALELTVQVRNKVIEAYQELIKMQI